MKKILSKGLTAAMVVTIMASGLSFADATTEEKVVFADGNRPVKERMTEKFGQGGPGREGVKKMDAEEMLAKLEARLEEADLTDDQVTKIEEQIERLENKIEFDATIDDLLEDKTDAEKVAALEDLLEDGDYDERQEGHINRLIQRYTVGEETMEAIREALQDAEKGERAEAVQALIDSGDYDDEALDFLNDMMDKIEEGQAMKEVMDGIREELKDLDADARDEKLQELIDSGDYDEKVTDQLQKMLDNEGKGPMNGERPEKGNKPELDEETSAIMKEIREELKDLDADAREEKIQELIDSGDYDEQVENMLQRMLDGKGMRSMNGQRPAMNETSAE